MAISAKGGLVAILRTVYSLRISNGAVSWEKTLIPTNFIGGWHPHWREDQEPFDPNHHLISDHPLKFIFRNRYTYSVTFNATEKYLLFTDITRDGMFTNRFVVYQIGQKDKLALQQVAYLRVPGLSAPISLSSPVKATFHPEAPVIIICDKYSVNSWGFLDGNCLCSFALL